LPSESLFAAVAGQTAAISQLRAAATRPVHAYLLVGPSGLQQRELARGFAAALLCPYGGCGECDSCRRVISGVHPDLVEIERAGAQLAVEEARRVVRLAYRRPLEASRQIVLVPDLHLARLAGPVLLKTLEDPPPSTVIVLLADFVSPELVTIASRCVRVDLRPVAEGDLEQWLRAGGLNEEAAKRVAQVSGGSPTRAEVLVADDNVGHRREMWRQVPAKLDGTGAMIARLTDELLDATSRALEPLRDRHKAEIEELAERARAGGYKGIPQRREVDERHRREERRWRTDDLRSGLAELAGAYRDRALERVSDRSHRGGGRLHDMVEACDLVGSTAAELVRNPNETLLLEALFVKLARLSET
jgi:DNA polymerase III subunit delta'